MSEIRQWNRRTCEPGYTHSEHFNIEILNMSEYSKISKI